MATAAVELDEEALIREFIAQIELPEGVQLKSLKPKTDWTGDPGWDIEFSASTKIPLTKSRLASLRKVATQLEDRIFSLHRERFPFIRFVDGR